MKQLILILLFSSSLAHAQVFEAGVSAGAFTTTNYSLYSSQYPDFGSAFPVKGGIVRFAMSLNTSYNINRHLQAGLSVSMLHNLAGAYVLHDPLYTDRRYPVLLATHLWMPEAELNYKLGNNTGYFYAGPAIGIGISDHGTRPAYGLQAGYVRFVSKHVAIYARVAMRHIAVHWDYFPVYGTGPDDFTFSTFAFPATLGLRFRI